MTQRLSSLPLSAEPTGRATGRTRRRAIVLGVVCLILFGALGGWWQFGVGRLTPLSPRAAAPAGATAFVADSLASAPKGVRVRVRVTNGTDVRGLARRATVLLRDLGYDVVEFDGDAKTGREQTVILSHTGHADWAQRLQRAMAASSIEISSDSSHFVDLSVLLGRDWKAPTQPLRP